MTARWGDGMRRRAVGEALSSEVVAQGTHMCATGQDVGPFGVSVVEIPKTVQLVNLCLLSAHRLRSGDM